MANVLMGLVTNDRGFLDKKHPTQDAIGVHHFEGCYFLNYLTY
jgi:hypothetical protein